MAPVNADSPAIIRFDLAHALDEAALKAQHWATFWERLPGQTWRADRQHTTAAGLRALRARVLDGTVTADGIDDEARALLDGIADLPDEFLEGTGS
jgi:hypothetical protein